MANSARRRHGCLGKPGLGQELPLVEVDRNAGEPVTSTELTRLNHDGAVGAVAFAPDGARMATASTDGSARRQTPPPHRRCPSHGAHLLHL
jgi:hypothetical protein